jgi:CheY-specific phosphatase CheX
MEYEKQIEQLVVGVWESILNLPIETDAAATPPRDQRMLAACVQISGTWQGAVAVSYGMELAAEAAAIMFATDRDKATPADMQDALGELANMVGGNFKALLPQPCSLSLPAVVEGTDFSMRIPGSKPVTHLTMRCGNHPVIITLLQCEKRAA